MKMRTFLSPVMYRQKLNAAFLVPLRKRGAPVCWFDSLLNGGVEIPTPLQKFKRRPLIWLVSGPPGTGKTTFALEMCCRLSATPQPDTNEPISSVYYSCESPVAAIKENIKSFGWPYVQDNITFIDEDTFRNVATPHDFFTTLQNKQFQLVHDSVKPQIVVIDSLNVLGSQVRWDSRTATEVRRKTNERLGSGQNEKIELGALSTTYTGIDVLRSIADAFKEKCWIVILIQNWEHDLDQDPSFAYLADIETRLLVRQRQNYLLNYIRIVKMRFQDHSRGEHLLKIYPAPDSARSLEGVPASGRIGMERNEGGIFVMPSIHRHLSALGGVHAVIREDSDAPKHPGGIEVPIDGFEKIVPLRKLSDGKTISGFPKHCCTALVGHRGAMKSHVAYTTLINHLKTGRNNCGVMLSLRDDVRAAMNTLEQICMQQRVPHKCIRQWMHKSRLDIVYFAPGYLPPSEFMHRVVVSIEGMANRHQKAVRSDPVKDPDGRNILCVLNGIDHLAARHPLCFEEQMFVPAIISYMTKSLVTTLVIAADDDKTALDESGLIPMAELLIRFETIRNKDDEGRDIPQPVTRVISQRVPAGAPSGGIGYLFRDSTSGAAKFKTTLASAIASL
jgi:KaiC/GvpD/RAD55 family RecA-like ATPase